MNNELHIVHAAETETGKRLNPGDVVEYVAHVVGGMVKVKLPDGTKDVIHPGCTKELK
jgi:hypothetical protein